jgi:hypothetical protein
MIAILKYPNPIFEELKTNFKLDEYHSNDLKDEMDIEE